MLQIKNTLGGGKPEGLYAWKKHEIGSELKIFNKSVSTLPYAFYYGPAVVLNGEIHILGSSDSSYYKYHYKWNGTSWVSVSTLPYNFSKGCAVVLNGEIHILGGSYNSSTKTSHYKWDGSSWTSVSTLPYSFYSGSAVVLNGEIHILGSDNSSNYTKHYKWDGTSWTSVSTLPYDFYIGSAVVLNNEIHILGSGASSKETKHYKWDGNSWTEVSTLPYSFYNGSAVVFDDEIHIMGGYITSVRNSHYKWNGSTWASVSTLPYQFYYGSAVVFDNGIHILGSDNSNYHTAHYLIIGHVPVYTFIDYIVSDKETAYPNGAVHTDGYFYRYAPEGLYAWKKSEGIPPVSNITLKFEMVTYGNPCVVKVSSDDIDLSLVDSTIFIGMTLSGTLTASSSATSFAFVSEDEFTKNSVTYSYNYDPSSQTITMNYEFTATVIWNNSVVSYSGNLSFLDYIVSDKETAYPDGGEKGGYWYEKVVDGFDLEKLGCTKFETGSFALTSPKESVEIAHSLGVLPKFVICASERLNNSSEYIDTFCAAISTNGYSGHGYTVNNMTNSRASYKASGTTTSVLKLSGLYDSYSHCTFKNGVPYHYIILA